MPKIGQQNELAPSNGGGIMSFIQQAVQTLAGAPQQQQSDQSQQMSMPNPMLPTTENLPIGVSDGYESVKNMPGIVEPGTPGLATARPIVNFANGLTAMNATPAAIFQYGKTADWQPSHYYNTYGSEYSATIPDGKYNVVIPQIFNGKLHSLDESIRQYQKTGQHFGKFDRALEEAQWDKGKITNSDRYSQKLHERKLYVNGKLYTGPANK